MQPRTDYPDTGRYALTDHKTVGPLFGSAVKIWLSKPSVFIVAALVVILPMELLFTGLLGGGFNDPEGLATPEWEVVDTLVVSLIGASLVTAAHARAVVALAAGENVRTGSALRLGGGAFLTVLGAALCYTLATIAGMLALIVPGIYLSVALLFGPQIAALTNTGPLDSLSSSYRLVRAAGWWRTFGYSILIFVLALVPALLLAIPILLLSELIGDPSVAGPISVVVGGVVLALIYSFTALVQSLLYFSYRAKVGDPWASDAAVGAPDLEAGADWDPSKSEALH
ncbi:MAG: hypothetical protein JHD16_09555 [Solirubrobacteraceae bacterium]|nr:hypothetical protein [Solirubrobacteraceae bacterium]